MKRTIKTAVFAFLFFLLIIINIATILQVEGNLLDFGSFLASGIYANNGGNPYNDAHPYIFEVDISSLGVGGRLPNLNPPVSVLLFKYFADADPFEAFKLWKTISVIVYLIAILPLTIKYKPSLKHFLWLFILTGIWHTIKLGQIYTFLLFFTVLTWLFSEKDKDIAAGFFLGLLISIKPNFILWLGLAIIAKKWKFSFGAIFSSLTMSLIPLLTNGLGIYKQWLSATKVPNSILMMPGNSSFIGLTSRLAVPELGAVIGFILTILLGMYIFRKNQNDSRVHLKNINELGILLSLLASPISWVGYTILLIPIFLSKQEWSGWLITSATLLCIPTTISFNLYTQSKAFFVVFGWVYGFALIFILLDVIQLPFPTPSNLLKQKAS